MSTRNKQLGDNSSLTCHSPGSVQSSAKVQQQMATTRPSEHPMQRIAAVSGRPRLAASGAEPQEPGASLQSATHPGRLAAGFAAADVQQLLLFVHCTSRGRLLGVRHERVCCRYQLTSLSASVCVASPQPNPACQPASQGGNSGHLRQGRSITARLLHSTSCCDFMASLPNATAKTLLARARLMMPLLLRRRWSLTLADQLLLAWILSMRLTLFASCCLRAAILSVSDKAPWSWLMARGGVAWQVAHVLDRRSMHQTAAKLKSLALSLTEGTDDFQMYKQ